MTDGSWKAAMRAMSWLLVAAALAGCVTGGADRVRREYPATHMGMPWRIVLHAPDAVRADAAAAASFRRVAELNAILSDYEPDSELSRLSRTSGSGVAVPLGPDLARVLRRAEEVSRAGEGAFDITVGPLVDVWKRARRQRALPAPDALARALAATGWTNVVLGRDAPGRPTATLLRPGMRLDPGGIAKGYALGEAAAVLRASGIRRALITAGGDMYALGAPPGESGWRVEIGALDAAGAPAGRFVRVRDAALVTSGDLFQRVEIGGVRYSHIVDPRTGRALTDHSQVTLIGRDPMTCDALSKVLSVSGPGAMPGLASRFGVEALVQRAPAGRVEIVESGGWRRYEGRAAAGLPYADK
jgi:thiamine biosynthesis lipoprotein